MASSKRARQRQNSLQKAKLESMTSAANTTKQGAWESRVGRLFEAEKEAWYKKNLAQNATGAIVLATFAYGMVAKQGAIIEAIGYKAGLQPDKSPIPTFRHILPEPFDFMSHMSNAAWTLLLMERSIPFTKITMRDRTFGIDQIDHRLYGNPEPSIPLRALKSGSIGLGLHVCIEAVSAGLPGMMGELMGGFDPIDAGYGAAAAVVIAGYDMHRRKQAINNADTI